MNNRYDFIYLFDVKNGNPNGDPDAGNAPRIDPETGNGFVTDVCLKRKIRNYVSLTHGTEEGFDIYVKEKAVLNNQHQRAHAALGDAAKDVDKARAWMCKQFFDIRMFGAVMTTGVNCGQVRGPVQLTFAESISPIQHISHTITRMAVTTERESSEQSGGNRTMGNKETVPYGLYKAHGFINPFLARQTGFGDEDLTLFWEALKNMFEHDRSAARGLMGAQRIIVFKHDSALGSAPANKLFDLVSVKRKEGVEVPRSFSDYEVTVGNAPAGVEIIELL